ncbi:subtilisin-like protein [Cadophora sp. DSE1049]|nr:subtilisin-like protein [Cadophora sp. DSE1049]
MSFGLDKENAEVQTAIRNAFFKNILMFAAASNSGGNLEVKYPARKDEVICVYATDGSGNAFTKNPNNLTSSSFHFATLGVGVKSSWPRKLHDPPLKVGEASERRQTGTSFATPIVAGIAACIIEFAIVQNVPDELLTVLKTRQAMQKTLLKLMVDDTPRSGLHYIHPWKMFANDRSEESIVYAMKDILGS